MKKILGSLLLLLLCLPLMAQKADGKAIPGMDASATIVLS